MFNFTSFSALFQTEHSKNHRTFAIRIQNGGHYVTEAPFYQKCLDRFFLQLLDERRQIDSGYGTECFASISDAVLSYWENPWERARRRSSALPPPPPSGGARVKRVRRKAIQNSTPHYNYNPEWQKGFIYELRRPVHAIHAN